MESASMSHADHGDDKERRLRAAVECHSFTFMSCSDLTSSSLPFIFSDCEGGDSDSESYIEIELDRGTAKINPSNKVARPGLGRQSDEELQLCVSVSSATSFPKLQPSSPQSWKNIRGANTCASNEGIGGWEEDIGVSGGNGRDSAGGATKFAAVCRLLTIVTTSLKIFPEISREPDGDSLQESRRCHQEPPRSKETARTTRRRNSAGVMQFLFKLRAMQFRTFLASLMKSRPVLAKGKNLGDDQWRERRLKETLRFSHRMSRGLGWKSRETIAGDDKTRSCPSSIKCSLINRENLGNSRAQTGECSIQDAIAHCKKSFTTSSNLTFKTSL
ncbi:hypothetical protein SAY86_021840 [Trapa natans]|uniref:Uncharacterized protein n=1 Tax=Trapa natans TaxID=22666 RepID=A0AAN7MZT0_TRANT|nr:hypothetical protein SAY86_021840 [Trapa natans]